VDVIAAKDGAGTLWLALTNLDPNRPADVSVRLSGLRATTASGETLTAPAVDSVNTFEAPTRVAPKPISGTIQGDRISLTLEPKSVTVVSAR
jgi:alpha-N-arabinofuranosidase